jgi:hypothetical protein
MSDVVAALGDMPELGGSQRVVLPDSFYPMRLEVEDVSVTDERDHLDGDGNVDPNQVIEGLTDVEGNPVPKGGVPYVQMKATVTAGPFAEVASFSSRLHLTPGKGKFIGFINHATKSVTGQPVNREILKKYGFEFGEGLSEAETQQVFRVYWFSLSPADRQKFMSEWCNLGKWDGAPCIVKVGTDKVDRRNEVTGEEYSVYFNRFQGFYALNDTKKGLAWTKKACFPAQEKWYDEMQAEG